MTFKIDYRKTVQYELMLGREATEAVRKYPVGYLPIGCLERHGDHLPMGLDVIKAHRICCITAHSAPGQFHGRPSFPFCPHVRYSRSSIYCRCPVPVFPEERRADQGASGALSGRVFSRYF